MHTDPGWGVDDQFVELDQTDQLRAQLERLRQLRELKQREQTGQADEARRYLQDPVGWVRRYVKWGPGEGLTDYQDEIIGQLPRRKRVAVRGPHGLGKTGLASLAVLWFVLTREQAGLDWKVLTTASAWRHLTKYLWPEIHKWAMRLDWDGLGRAPFNERTELLDLTLKQKWGAASAVASSKAELIEGAHADSLLYLIDEAKIVPDAVWDAIEGAFSGGRAEGYPEALALAISTPGPPVGRFYEIHKRARGLEDWWVRHVKIEEAIAAGRVAREWVDQRRKQWGADSALYANRVLGEFHASDEDSLIPLAWVDAAIERWRLWDEAGRPELALQHPRVLGVDVARSGRDSTVFASRVGYLITGFELHNNEDTMKTTARVSPLIHESDEGRPRVTGVIDSAGVGGGVFDRLRELKLPVVAYTGAARTGFLDRTKSYGMQNTRSGAYWNLRELLDPANDSIVMLPPDDLMVSDLTTPTWDISSGAPPKIVVEKKDDVVARLGRSPDRGDACFIAGTLISTESGDHPIEDIRPGDLVFTRDGLRSVIAHGLTSSDVEVFTLELEDGRTLTGTGNHPVWNGTHFRPLDTFAMGDSVWVCEPSKSPMVASSSRAIQKARDGNTGFTTGPTENTGPGVSGRSMSKSSKLRSAQSPTGGSSTTVTTIPSTIGRRIWRLSLLLTTPPITPERLAGGGDSTKSTWQNCVSWRRSGTGPLRAAPGIPNTADKRGLVVSGNPQDRVSGVGRMSIPSSPTRAGGAGALADATMRGPSGLAHMESTEHALSAGLTSVPKERAAQPRTAPIRVRRLHASGTADVWNLQVDQTPEYFANGVLVHNCVMAFWFEQMRREGAIAKPTGRMPTTSLGPLSGTAQRGQKNSPMGPLG